MIELLNIDCMEYMKTVPDKGFDLAVVDPEYGADIKGPCGRLERYGGLRSVNSRPPADNYFSELYRVSKQSIVWGGNYFRMPPCKCFIVWDKKQPQKASYAQAEYAWTNLEGTAKIFEKRVINADTYRIHPTQKPVDLYFWILNQFAKPGQRILDTHLGSGSSAIAAHYFGCDFVGCEIDTEYFNAAKERFDRETRQVAMW